MQPSWARPFFPVCEREKVSLLEMEKKGLGRKRRRKSRISCSSPFGLGRKNASCALLFPTTLHLLRRIFFLWLFFGGKQSASKGGKIVETGLTTQKVRERWQQITHPRADTSLSFPTEKKDTRTKMELCGGNRVMWTNAVPSSRFLGFDPVTRDDMLGFPYTPMHRSASSSLLAMQKATPSPPPNTPSSNAVCAAPPTPVYLYVCTYFGSIHQVFLLLFFLTDFICFPPIHQLGGGRENGEVWWCVASCGGKTTCLLSCQDFTTRTFLQNVHTKQKFYYVLR